MAASDFSCNFVWYPNIRIRAICYPNRRAFAWPPEASAATAVPRPTRGAAGTTTALTENANPPTIADGASAQKTRTAAVGVAEIGRKAHVIHQEWDRNENQKQLLGQRHFFFWMSMSNCKKLTVLLVKYKN